MKLNEEKLKEKGWEEHEIEHARGVLERAEQEKHPRMKQLEHMTFIILLVIVIFGAIASTWLMEPLLIAMNTTQAYVTTLILGGLFGTLASILMRDIEHTQQHHHLILASVVPVSAIVASIIIVNKVNEITETIEVATQHNPYVLGVLFTIATLIPYAIITIKDRKNR